MDLTKKGKPCEVVRLVVWFIGIFAILGLLGIIIFVTVLSLKDKEVSVAIVSLLTTLATLCGAAIGSLGSMLSNTGRDQGSGNAVTIANSPNDPVPVTDSPPKGLSAAIAPKPGDTPPPPPPFSG